MSYDYSPESDGLEYVGSIDFETGAYEWDTITAYVHPETNQFYWEDGSGCSCNGPMEDITSLASFETGSLGDFVKLVQARVQDELLSTYNTRAGKANILDEAALVLKEAVKYA